MLNPAEHGATERNFLQRNVYNITHFHNNEVIEKNVAKAILLTDLITGVFL